jgi:uncharacterized protein (DUF934 family)
MSEPKPLLPPLKPAQNAPRLWSGNRFVADPWSTIGDDEPLPIEGRVIVSLARWRAEQATLAAVGVPIGVKVGPGETVDPTSDDIGRLGVIALAFPKFTDGRAYSAARRLREQGYRGEIRAIGDVLLDQIPLMLRCGFDALEITHAATIRSLEHERLPVVSRVYQAGAETDASVWHSRRSVAGLGTRVSRAG